MGVVQKLRSIVAQNCISKGGDPTTLAYWSEVIFAKSVFALVPLSLLAIIPAVIVSIDDDFYLILGFDIFSFLMLIFVGYVPGIAVDTRKIILLFVLFMAAFVLLIELGSFGPGLIYLLASTVFILILFPHKNPKVPFLLTLIFCVLFGLLIHFKFFNYNSETSSRLLEWVVVSSNVLFLSAVFTMFIPFFFSKLETTIAEKLQLVESLRITNLELEKSIADVKNKNIVLEEFAFVASHDLQEPLRTVSSFLTKLSHNYKNQLDQKANQCIYFANEGTNRMRQILNDLLNYSISGRPSEILEAVDLQEMMVEYRGSRRQLIEEKSITIEEGPLPVILATKPCLIQTFHCLLDNAITFTKPDIPPKIKIKAEEKQSEWQFSVEDNGIGINPQFFEKIFVIFQRLHNRDEYTGTGIGLAIAKKNVDSWGGKIWLKSTPGLGTTFYFTLPCPKVNSGNRLA